MTRDLRSANKRSRMITVASNEHSPSGQAKMTASTLMTFNRPLEEWGKLIDDLPVATAILERFLHHATVIKIKGKSYRIRDKARPLQTEINTSTSSRVVHFEVKNRGSV